MSEQFSLFDDQLQPVPEPALLYPADSDAVDVPLVASVIVSPVSSEIASEEAESAVAMVASSAVAESPVVATPTPEEKAALLDRVRSPALGCVRCGLSASRTNVVFGEGNPAAPLVFVGEGPGENEDATGRPFVGRAGKLLDEVLRRNGMNRNHVYICNTVKCRASELQNGRRLNRPPTSEEIFACLPWLEEQIRIIQPLVIVCLGAPAANTIIHKGFRLTAERGRWFSSTTYAPWAMAVFHPAYVLRLAGPGYDAALDTLVQDIGQARQKVIEVKKQRREERLEAAATPPPPRSLFD